MSMDELFCPACGAVTGHEPTCPTQVVIKGSFIRIVTTRDEEQMWIGSLLVRTWPRTRANHVTALNLHAAIGEEIAEQVRRAMLNVPS